MYNLIMKDLKLAINPWLLLIPLLSGTLMLIPGYLYFVILLYCCWITIPNILQGYKIQNDLMFSLMMPVSKKDIVKAKITVIAIVQLLHLLIAMFFSIFTFRLYPNFNHYFFEPNLGFWGLCFIMFAIFNIILLPLYYKTAYKFGLAIALSIVAAMVFACVTQWLGIQNNWMHSIFYSPGVDNTALQLLILAIGIFTFIGFNIIAYKISLKRFLKLEII